MPSGISRRTYLRASGGTAALIGLGGMSGSVIADTADDCPDLAALYAQRDELEQELTALTSAVDQTIAQISTQESELHSALNAWREDKIQYPAAIRDTMLSVGEMARESVVQLVPGTPDQSSVSMSTAWFIEEDLLLTNAHNVHGLPPNAVLTGWTFDGEQFEFEILGSVPDERPDVALLRADIRRPPLEVGENIDSEEHLICIGHPGGFGNWIITAGTFVDYWNRGPDGEWFSFRSTVPGLTGNSGSPTLTLDGSVVGMMYGGTPGNPPSIPPEPAELDVRTAPMVAEGTLGLHVPIDTALSYYEEWR